MKYIVAYNSRYLRLLYAHWGPSVVKDDNANKQMVLFPNPADNNVSVKFELKTNDNIKVSITDASGKSIENLYEGFAPSGNQTFNWNCSAYPAGIYLCNITGANTSQTFKIIVNR